MNKAQWLGIIVSLWSVAALGCDVGLMDSPPGSSATASDPPIHGIPSVGAPAPEFHLRNLDGETVALADYRGKIVFLNFWATWCGPCRVEMPMMEELYQELKREEFVVLAVSTDAQGQAATRPFRESLGLSFPILHDPEFRVGTSYGTRSLPITFLLDREGIIRHKIFGARDWRSPEAKRLIQTLLKAA